MPNWDREEYTRPRPKHTGAPRSEYLNSVLVPNTPEIEEESRIYAQQISNRRQLVSRGAAHARARTRAAATTDARALLTSIYIEVTGREAAEEGPGERPGPFDPMPGLFVREQIVQNLRALSPDNLAKHLQMKQARMSEIEYQYSQAKSGNEIWEARKLVEEDREIRNEIWEARELMKEKAEEKQKEKANENEKTETVKEKEKENEGKEEDEVGSVSPWDHALAGTGSVGVGVRNYVLWSAAQPHDPLAVEDSKYVREAGVSRLPLEQAGSKPSRQRAYEEFLDADDEKWASDRYRHQAGQSNGLVRMKINEFLESAGIIDHSAC